MDDSAPPQTQVADRNGAIAGDPTSRDRATDPVAASRHLDLPRTRPILSFHPDLAAPDSTTDEPILLNRELSWLAFNERVLALADRDDLPLLERAMFLSIFTSNLDEFFQVRVAGLMEQQAAGVTKPAADGMRAVDQLAAIHTYANELVQRQSRIFHEQVAPALAERGIRYCDWPELDEDDRAWLVGVFEEQVFPVLTPLAVDPAHPFPYISNLSLNLAVVVRDPIDGVEHFARVKVPPILDRFVVMPDGERFVPIEQVIAAHLDRLFPGLEVVDHHIFRVVRNADLAIEEEDADDLLLAIESELKARRRGGRVVRLEIEPGMPERIRDLLTREMEVGPDQVDVVDGPLDLTGLLTLHAMDRPDLKYATFAPTVPSRLLGLTSHADLFAQIREGGVLLHHPYEAFSQSVQRFVEAAATDPDVLALKITLYRTSGAGSPLVKALVKAAENGKQVVALVELKARFEEEANIEWARLLEEVGVHVAYGVVGLKTHTKIALVARKEGDRIRRYCHIGTGNYNDKTARIYEDLGLLTADPELGADVTDLFNVLTGYGRRRDYRRLVTAPATFRPKMLELIRRETEAADGTICLKLNALVDREMIEALYAASEAGTPVDLIVRGICCLRPGVAGLSENIRVRSIIGRYLEHSRIYRFGSAERGFDYYIGSGDLMPRNLDRRVEAFVPIEVPAHRLRLQQILDILLEDDVLAWEAAGDGSWQKVPRVHGFESHERLERIAQELE
jgi:polyphosphate kinase